MKVILMTLKKLVLYRFQKHKKKTIRFDPHVTTIVGDTNSGKSTIVRALRYLYLNHPSGKNYSYNRKGRFRIRVFFDDQRITRVKSKRTNTYQIGSQTPLKAVGVGKVPPAVADLVKVSDLNFQQQIDPPFWFTETAGKVSKKLNEIVNLGKIDRTLDNVAKKLRKAKSEVEITSERLEEARERKKDLNWVPEFHRRVKRLEMLSRKRADVAIKRSQIASLIKDVSDIKRRIDRASKAILYADKVSRAGARALELTGRRKQLENLLKEINDSSEIAKHIVPDIGNLEGVRGEADKAAEDRRDLEYMVQQLKEASEEVKQCRTLVIESERKLAKVKRCPVCNQKVKGKSLQSHLETFTHGTKRRQPGQKKTGTK
jgi:exonuclease SbcC